MDETPDGPTNESDSILDLHKGTLRKVSNENDSEGFHDFEPGPFVRSRHPRSTPDGFPGLSGSDQKRGPRSDPASEFWSQRVANLRALDTCSNSNRRMGDSTALVKEPANLPAKIYTAESAPIHSSDKSHHSRILSFLESGSDIATWSVVDHPAQQVPNSSVKVLDEVPNQRNELLHPSRENSMEVLAPDNAGRDPSSEVKAQTYRSPIPAIASNTPNKTRDGEEYESQMGSDAISSNIELTSSHITTYLESKDQLLRRPGTGNPKPAIPLRPIYNNKTSSRLSGGSESFLPEQRRNPDLPLKPFHVNRTNESSSAKATLRLWNEPRSVTPITPSKNPTIRHPRSFSAEAAAVHPSPPSSSSITPWSSQSNDRRRSVSIGNGYSNTSYVSAMPNTPLHQRTIWHSRQLSMGTPSTPVESGFFNTSGASSPYFIDPHYPEPHQHTPEGEAQVFGIQGPMPPRMPAAHFPHHFSPDMPSFFHPMHSSNNPTIHHEAQMYEQIEQNNEFSQSNHFESYATSQAANATTNAADLHQNGNMYTQDTNGYGPRFYSNHTDPAHQLNQNLYSPLEPHREPSRSNQRTARDLFIPEDIRLKLHTRTEATLRVFAVMNTPTIDHYHTLTPLTAVNQQQSQMWRGYSSTTYKAISAKDGRTYCLRRIHGFQATRFHENAFQAVREKWTAVTNSNVVALHSAFTTTNFDDSSLIIVSDYHPDSKTVAETHFSQTSGRSNRNAPPPISDRILWSYIVQITNALKAVHSAQLAVRVFEPTKVIVTDENRIRLNGCALEDLLDNEAHDIAELQRLDLYKLGNFILAVGTGNVSNSSSRTRPPDVFAQNYYKTNPQLKIVVEWLLGHDRAENNEGVDVLIKLISSNAIDAFDYSLRLNDQLYFSLNKEIENSRIVRLMTKLNCLNERPEYEHDRTYSTQGTRAVLGLFRDYVFHQVNAQANPVVDMGHILSCLNKLDAGIEERIALTARDEQSVIVVSYKELKVALESTWQELMRRASG